MEKILIIEDDRELNQAIGYALEKNEYKVSSAFSVETAKKEYMENQMDLILLDVNLPDGEVLVLFPLTDINGVVLYVYVRDKHEIIKNPSGIKCFITCFP